VEDQGDGIAAENLPRVFGPFFTTKDVGEAPARALLATASCASTAAGSTSRATRVRAPLRAPRGWPPRAAARAREGRILVVDDDRELCAWIRRVSAHGFITESHTAPTDRGAGALRRCTSTSS
jgi:hypothetical protein